MASIAYLLAQRAKAQRQHDMGQVRAINADLARLGHVDQPRSEAPEPPVEPTETERRPYGLPERRPSAKRRPRAAS